MYIGIDVHKKYCQAHVLDCQGQTVAKEKVKNDEEGWAKFLESLPLQERKAVLEAGYGWMPVYDLLNEKGVQAILADQNQTKAIAKATKLSTDKVDARTLAILLRANLIPEVYALSKEQRQIRNLLRYRISLVRERTKVKNSIRGLLANNGHKILTVPDLLKSEKQEQALKAFELPHQSQIALDSQVRVHDFLTKEFESIKKKLEQIAKTNEQVKVLTEIVGISWFSGLAIITETGAIERFQSPKSFCRWIGIVPSTKQSADKVVHGKITRKGNKTLRWVLSQCTNSAIIHSPYLKNHYHQIKKRRGRNKAKVACMRKLATKIWYTLHYANISQ